MMKQLYLFALSLAALLPLRAQDTFSIVAVDSATGEVGSAGATCLQAPFPAQGALIISDVLPGKGAIHTQALWNQYNQDNARYYMEYGYSADEIIANVNLDDFDGDSTVRQYGVAMFDTAGRVQVAAYTGVNCYDYKNHLTGPYYSVQGNILSGQGILDSMEARFLNTSGTLAERLMAALQGANVPGADSRCLSEGVPSQSAFVRVAKPADSDTALYLHLVVKSRPYGMSPIDSLQTLFDAWQATASTGVETPDGDDFSLYPNPATSSCYVSVPRSTDTNVEVYDPVGNRVFETACSDHCALPLARLSRGVYFVRAGSHIRKLVVQ